MRRECVGCEEKTNFNLNTSPPFFISEFVRITCEEYPMRYLHYSVQQTAICLPNWGAGVLTWGRRVPEAADKIAVYRVKVFLFELFRLVWETLIVSSEI